MIIAIINPTELGIYIALATKKIKERQGSYTKNQ